MGAGAGLESKESQRMQTCITDRVSNNTYDHKNSAELCDFVKGVTSCIPSGKVVLRRQVRDEGAATVSDV